MSGVRRCYLAMIPGIRDQEPAITTRRAVAPLSPWRGHLRGLVVTLRWFANMP